jgi:hypothetical protein
LNIYVKECCKSITESIALYGSDTDNIDYWSMLHVIQFKKHSARSNSWKRKSFGLLLNIQPPNESVIPK